MQNLHEGDAAWQIAPQQISEVIDCSTDFFFILSFMNKLGFDLLTASQSLHPMTKGLFNFAEAYMYVYIEMTSSLVFSHIIHMCVHTLQYL